MHIVLDEVGSLINKVYQREGFMNTLEGDIHMPGPGAYKESQTFGKEGAKITLKPRLKDILHVPAPTPGPGAYKDVTSLPSNGSNFLSKFKSVNSGMINSKGASRFVGIDRK